MMAEDQGRPWWARPAVMGTVLGVIVLGLLVYFGVPRLLETSLFTSQHFTSSTTEVDRAARGVAAPSAGEAGRTATSQRATADQEGNGRLSVKEATLEARSDSIGRDVGFVHGRVEEHGGYVESSRGRETETTIKHRLETRVPSDRYDTYLAELREHLDVTNFRTRDYRISIRDSRDEIEVLNRTLDELDRLRREVDNIRPDDRLELLMQLNNRELELARKLKREHREVAQARRKSAYATVTVELRQRKSVDVTVWPEDFAKRFQQRLRTTFDTLASVLIHTPARMLEIAVRVVQLALYLLALVATVGLIGYAGWWLYRRVF